MSVEPAGLVAAFVAGTVTGIVYLGILWGSVYGLARSRRPLARLGVGAVLRLGLVLGSLYLVMDGHWERLLAGLAGFALARIAATRWASGAGSALAGAASGGGDADHA